MHLIAARTGSLEGAVEVVEGTDLLEAIGLDRKWRSSSKSGPGTPCSYISCSQHAISRALPSHHFAQSKRTVPMPRIRLCFDELLRILKRHNSFDGRQFPEAIRPISASPTEKSTKARLTSEARPTLDRCDNSLLVSAINASTPVFQRSQILNELLTRNGLSPVLFKLSAQQQLAVGKNFLRCMNLTSPSDPTMNPDNER